MVQTTVDPSLPLPQAIKYNSEQDPHLPFYFFVDPENGEQIQTITHLQFYEAGLHVANRLHADTRPGSPRDVVAILALSDTVVYQPVVLGCMVAGLVPFVIFPKLSPEGILNLLKVSNCHRTIITQATLKPLLDAALSLDPAWNISIEEMPRSDEIYVDEKPKPFPISRILPDEVSIYVHSSGSTGLPKAIPITWRVLETWTNHPMTADLAANQAIISAVALPNGHAQSFLYHLVYPIYSHCPSVVYPPLISSGKSVMPPMPTPQNVLEHTKKSNATSLVIVPAFLHAWARDKDSVKFLTSLEQVYFGGGPLIPEVGANLAAAGVPILSAFGATETGPLSVHGSDEWQWIKLNPQAKIHWAPQGNGLYELQLLATGGHLPAVQNMSNPLGYATSDLWEKHPSKDLWRIVGRIDDVIVHSSGEKTVPAPLELIITASPLISSAVIFGRNQDHAGVLIEPTDSTLDLQTPEVASAYCASIWPIIEQANSVAPKFSRVSKELILLATRPLPRTAKGTVMRKIALNDFDVEIKALYQSLTETQKEEGFAAPNRWTETDLESWLYEQTRQLTPGKVQSSDDDLFEQGFDSLSATMLHRRLLLALQTYGGQDVAQQLNQNAVYAHPTLKSLSRFVAQIAARSIQRMAYPTPRHEIDEMIAKYSTDFPSLRRTDRAEEVGQDAPVVLVTGTTGSLGSFLLRFLLERDDVAKVYALNRPGDQPALHRQQDALISRGLHPSLASSPKLVLLEGDLSQPNLSLAEEIIIQLLENVSLIIHNAWRVDFNFSLDSFENHIQGTRHLVDFGLQTKHSNSLRFMFISSASIASFWRPEDGPFPESIPEQTPSTLVNGYAQSKYVAEQIIATSGLQSTSLRVGQMVGGEPIGAWWPSDWIPILVKSSQAMGQMPSSPGHVSWIPLDRTAQVVLDVVFDTKPITKVVNLVHPRPTPWNNVMRWILAAMKEQGLWTSAAPLPSATVPLPEWVAGLEQVASRADTEDLEKIPAIKLLPFFQTLAATEKQMSGTDYEPGTFASYAFDKALRRSPTLRTIAPLDEGLAKLWVEYWVSVGFLSG